MLTTLNFEQPWRIEHVLLTPGITAAHEFRPRLLVVLAAM